MLITLLPIKRRNDESLLRYNFLFCWKIFFLHFNCCSIIYNPFTGGAVCKYFVWFEYSKINLYAHLATWTLIGIQMVNFIALFPTLPLDTAAQARFKSRFFWSGVQLYWGTCNGCLCNHYVGLFAESFDDRVKQWCPGYLNCAAGTWGWVLWFIWGQEPFCWRKNQRRHNFYIKGFPFHPFWCWYYWEKHGCCNTKIWVSERKFICLPWHGFMGHWYSLSSF